MDVGMVEWNAVGMIGRGLVIGLVLAVPVGPIGMLCIVRTLRFGRLAGLATDLGAAMGAVRRMRRSRPSASRR